MERRTSLGNVTRVSRWLRSLHGSWHDRAGSRLSRDDASRAFVASGAEPTPARSADGSSLRRAARSRLRRDWRDARPVRVSKVRPDDRRPVGDHPGPEGRQGRSVKSGQPVSAEVTALLSGGGAVCRTWSEQDEGPYHREDQPSRREITEDRNGLPLGLGLSLGTADGTLLRGGVVEIWHCDASGRYSGCTSRGRRSCGAPR
jgi:hypothetical protein